MLKPYQQDAVEFALNNDYSILALEPGLGKSYVAIEVRKRTNLSCLVICPSYLILNWVKEINKWDPRSNITTFQKKKDIYEVFDTDYVVISYNMVQEAEQLFNWADIVVIDEAHSLKSMEAQRTTFVHRCIYENSSKKVMMLTGTPIKNRVKEFYSLLAICHYNPKIEENKFLDRFPTEIDFADHFSNREEYKIVINGKWVNIVKWTGIKNLDELKLYLKGKYFRVRSKDVLDLPPITYKNIQVSNSKDTELLNAFNAYFKEHEDNGSVKPNAKALAALKKVPFTIQYVKNLLEETGCALVYSDHIQAAEEIAKAFNVQALTGKVQSSVRSQLADDFQSGKGELLVCTIGSMKEGKDLFRSSHIVFNDICWTPGDMKQVIYRIQRIGQTGNCTIHHILGSPQDAYIHRVIYEKIKVIEKAT